MAIFSRHHQTSATLKPALRLGQYLPWHGDTTKIETVVAHAVDPSATAPVERGLYESVAANQRPALHYLHDEKLGISGNVWHQGREHYLAVIGSPEIIIARSDLTDTERERATLESRRLGRDARSVMAVAELTLSRPVTSLAEDTGHALSFIGFVTVIDSSL